MSSSFSCLAEHQSTKLKCQKRQGAVGVACEIHTHSDTFDFQQMGILQHDVMGEELVFWTSSFVPSAPRTKLLMCHYLKEAGIFFFDFILIHCFPEAVEIKCTKLGEKIRIRLEIPLHYTTVEYSIKSLLP